MSLKSDGNRETGWRVGLLGCGGIADVHARALESVPGVSLVAVCDSDRAKALALQKRYAVEGVFASLDEMLDGARLDTLHILTPPATHARLACQCMERGLNPFVEKPLCISGAECRELEQTAARTRRTVGVNHTLTSLPSYRRLLEQIRNCRLGRIDYVFVVYNMPLRQLAAGQDRHWMFEQPGNIVLELGPHPVSLIEPLLGPVTAASTTVSGTRTLSSGKRFYDTWQGSLVCARGTAQICLAVAKEYLECVLYVIGQDGSALVDLVRDTLRVNDKSRFSRPFDDLRIALSTSRQARGDGIANFSRFLRGVLNLGPPGDPYFSAMHGAISRFHEALRSGKKPPMGLAQGVAVVDACEALIESGIEFAGRGVRKYAQTR